LRLLESRSSTALIIAIVFTLLLIAVWYVTPAATVSALLISDLENLDSIGTMEGTAGKEGYFLIRTVFEDVWEVPILVKAHVYTTNVTEDEIILRIDANVIRADTNETIPDLSGTSIYVINKLTHENVKDSPQADKPREGYDPFYPSHLEAGEDIPNVWLDNLNETGTLEFVRTVKIEDVELYEYFVNKTITKELVIPDLGDTPEKPGNYTLTSIKTVLIEPLSGLPMYTSNETFIIVKNPAPPVVYVTYKDKAVDLVTSRLAHGAMELLEFDKEVKGWILGAIFVTLIVAFIFNTRSLYHTHKMLPEAKT